MTTLLDYILQDATLALKNSSTISSLSFLCYCPNRSFSREQLGFLNSQKAFRDLNAIITITKKVELLFYNPSYNCSFLCATTVIIRQGESFPSGYKRCFSKKFCCSPEIFPTFSWVVSPLKKFRWNFPCLFHAIFLLDNDNNRARNYSTFLCNWGGENFNLGIFPVCYKHGLFLRICK